MRLWLWVALVILLASCGGGGGGDSSPPRGASSCDDNSLCGKVISAPANITDSDVNDPSTTVVGNNNFAEAQAIPNPAVVGGYVSIVGAGTLGNLSMLGDRSDYYSVYLSEGQTISLVIADDDPYMNDLDLYVYRESGALVWSSYTRGNVESVTVPTTATGAWNGNYFVEVYAYADSMVGGASNYVLSIDQTASSTAAGQSLAVNGEFVPGEVIVKYRDTKDGTERPDLESLGMHVKEALHERVALLKLPEDAASTSKALSALGIKRKTPRGREKALSVQDQRKMDTLTMAQALSKRPDVEYAEPNYLLRSQFTPNDTDYAKQWHYPLINLPTAWDSTVGAGTVTVAVVDTGVLLDHPDLAGQLVAGYDFVSNVDYAIDGNGIDSDPNDPGDKAYETYSSFHGTHVAGTVAAATNNSLGAAGVAGGVKVMPVRVLGKGGGTTLDVMQGVLYAAGLPNSSGTVPESPADIINLSLGGGFYSDYAQDIFNQVRNEGVIVVAAAGNDNTSSPMYPAAYSGVVSVSAVGPDKSKASYSNYGTTIDVAAPGGDGTTAGGVWSLMGDDFFYTLSNPSYFNYAAASGTSMAAPHMAGVAALMKSIYPSLTPSQLDGLLACGSITEDLAPAGRDDSFGFGLIDASKAVNEAVAMAGGAGGGCSMLQASPSQLSFGTSNQTLTLQIDNIGTSSATISTVSDDALWLTVSELSVDPLTKLGSYTVTVDRDALDDGSGIYRATIQFSSAEATTLSVPVAVQKANTSLADDAGYLYLMLVHATTEVLHGYTHMAATDGSYPFAFSGIAPGEYYLVAGTDNNNDGFICEPGESCGRYFDALGNSSFTVTEEGQLGLDFLVGYELYMSGMNTLSSSQSGLIKPYKIPEHQVKAVP